MTYTKIVSFSLFLLFFSADAAQNLVVLAGEALFKANTTTPKTEFYVLNANKELARFYVQGGTLEASGREGIVVTRLSLNNVNDTEVSDSTLRSYELPAGSSKILIASYTNFPDPFNYLGAIVVGTQEGVYALLAEDQNDRLIGGCNWGWRANMSDLNAGYWAHATMCKIFDNEIVGNIVMYAAKGNGVYYVHRGVSTSKITDTIYRFINQDLQNGIENADPLKLIVSGENGAPSTITSVDVIQYGDDAGKEQLLIGSHEGVYITTVTGGIQQANLTADDITLKLLADKTNQGIKYFARQDDGSFNIAGRVDENTYATYNVTINLNVDNDTNPTITVNGHTDSSWLEPQSIVNFPDMVSQFFNDATPGAWAPIG